MRSAAPSPRRPLRRTGAVLGALSLALVVSACFPTGPVETWVTDRNGDGRIDEAEVEQEKQVIVARVVAAVEEHRQAVQRHPFLTCVRQHESDRGGAYPYAGGYRAENPYSSASGAYQFLDSTWRNVSTRAGHPGYARASHAPWHVQDAVALYLHDNGGRSAWRGTGC